MPLTTITYRPRLLCAGIFCFLTAAATAQEPSALPVDEAALAEDVLRRYTVELIVFSYGDSIPSESEIFIPEPVVIPELPADSAEFMSRTDSSGLTKSVSDIDIPEKHGPVVEDEDNSSEDTVSEFGDFLGDVEFEDEELVELIANDRIDLQMLMPDELTMTDIHEKLILLDAYQPVMWAGWTQGTLTEEETPFIRLRRLGNIPLAFDGSLKLYLSRFLHLVVDIAMDEESPPTIQPALAASESPFGRRVLVDFGYPVYAVEPTPTIRYKILEDRIFKSEDIRYFDHPKFGVLAKVTRYEAPEDIEEEEETEFEEEPDPIVPRTTLSRSN